MFKPKKTGPAAREILSSARARNKTPGPLVTVSDAFRLLMVHVAKEKALPFEPLSPNAKTIRAMKEARRAKLKGFTRVEYLMADLNAKD